MRGGTPSMPMDDSQSGLSCLPHKSRIESCRLRSSPCEISDYGAELRGGFEAEFVPDRGHPLGDGVATHALGGRNIGKMAAARKQTEGFDFTSR